MNRNVSMKTCLVPFQAPMKPRPAPETTKKVAFKKMMDFVKGEDGSQVANNQKEMNQKLQIMLEETLTKNMHLQQVGLFVC